MKKILLLALFILLALPLASQAETGDDIWIVSTGAEATFVSLLENDYNVSVKTSEEIEQGVPSDIDLLIYPGGLLPILQAMDEELKIAVREYVENGGSYLGSCGGSIPGARQLTHDYGTTQMIGLVPANAYDYLAWAAAGYSGQFTFSEDDLNGDYKGTIQAVGYTGGPAFEIISGSESEVNVLATYTSNIPGAVVSTAGKAAISASAYGLGKVVLIAPHPESNENTRFLFFNLLEWSLDKPEPEPIVVTLDKVQNVKVPKKKIKKKRAKIKWEAVESATFYAVKILNKKKTKKIKLYKNVTNTSKLAKKLKPGKIYMVKVRAKTAVEDEIVKGKWSKAKQFKTKSN